MQGWISLHRKIMNHPFYLEKRVFSKYEAWIDIVMRANHKDNKVLFDGGFIMVKRGEHLTSIRKLCDKWGWSNSKTTKFLETLENDEMITKKSDSKKTLLTVVNYDFFQTLDGEETTVKRHRNDSEATLKHTNNNELIMINNENKKDMDANASKRFVKPTVEQVLEYCQERKNNVDAEKFINFYESKGWKIGANSMKNWKAAVHTWEKKSTPIISQHGTSYTNKNNDTTKKIKDVPFYD